MTYLQISRKLSQLKSFELPPVQTLPKPNDIFVFLHIEKTAGTTLRE
jgi:hypothetical protein